MSLHASELKLVLPPNEPGGKEVDLDDAGSLVVIGANGSGKSRFGRWLEDRNRKSGQEVHRITAQRMLTMTDFVEQMPLELAKIWHLSGSKITPEMYQRDRETYDNHRWVSQQRDKAFFDGRPVTGISKDFPALLAALFAQDNQNAHAWREFKALPSHHDVAEQGAAAAARSPGLSILAKVFEIWHELLPHRRLYSDSGRLLARLDGDKQYGGSELSDGERVVIYLLGQVLLASQSAIIIVDEPELHLHRALLVPLWNALERERDDCFFVYLTHDVDFAITRVQGKLAVIQEYCGEGGWSWQFVDRAIDLPEADLLRILGNRRPVLYVEGVLEGLDLPLYQAIFPGWDVREGRSCETVKSIVRGFRELRDPVVRVEVWGLIDRDERDADELKALRKRNIVCLPVRQIESMLLSRHVIEAFARHDHRSSDEVETIWEGVAELVVSRTCDRQETIAESVAKTIYTRRIVDTCRSLSFSDLADFSPASKPDLNEIRDQISHSIHQAVLSMDVEVCLSYFDKSKMLLKEVGRTFFSVDSGKNDQFARKLVRLIQRNDSLRSKLASWIGLQRGVWLANSSDESECDRR